MRPAPLSLVDPLFALARRPGEAIEAALGRTLADLERFGIERAGISLDEEPELARAALAAHPARFFARTEADPRRGMDELRRLEALAREWPLRLVTASPARHFVPIDDKLYYPLFAKCVELDLALAPSLGVPRERVPFAPQKVERIDEVAWFFPELRLVIREGAEPWQALAVLLMRKYPNLSYCTGGVLPSELPAEILDFAGDDGAHQVWFASQPAAGAPAERCYKELGELPLARSALPRFLRDNALRVLRLAHA